MEGCKHEIDHAAITQVPYEEGDTVLIFDVVCTKCQQGGSFSVVLGDVEKEVQW